MWTQVVTWGLALAGLYLLIGLAFALHFVARRIGRIDPDAREGSLGFKLLVFPGVAALWPLLLGRPEVRGEPPARERNAHREAAS